MSGQGQWLDWINENNQEQTRWALNYLNRNAARGLNSGRPFQQIREAHHALAFLTSAADVEARVQLLTRMRAAWSKHLSRKRSTGRKPYSVEMSTQVGPALKRLSQGKGGLPISQVLESLILDTDAYKKNLERQKKEEIAKIKPPRQDIDRQIKKQRLQLDVQKRIIQEWESAADNLLTQVARFQVALRAYGLLDENRKLQLEPKQEIAAKRLQRQWKNALTKSIKANTGLARLVLGSQNLPADD